MNTGANSLKVGKRIPRYFLRLAYVANPFAYMAINTLMVVAPTITQSKSACQRLREPCGSPRGYGVEPWVSCCFGNGMDGITDSTGLSGHLWRWWVGLLGVLYARGRAQMD